MKLYLVNVEGSVSERFWTAREVDGFALEGPVGAYANAQERGAVFVLAKNHAEAILRGRVLQQAAALLAAVRAEAVGEGSNSYSDGYAAALCDLSFFVATEKQVAKAETLSERLIGVQSQLQRTEEWIAARLPSTKAGV